MAVTVKGKVSGKANLTLVTSGKKKPGRPKWLPDLAEVEKLASQGLSNEQIAQALSVSPTTLYAHKAQYSEFTEAIKRGSAKGAAAVTNSLFTKAVSGDTTACIFYLKARSGWSDKITALEPHQGQADQWVHKLQHDQKLAEGKAAHEYNVKIGQQVADAAKECLRILEMSGEELLACKDQIEAEFAESEKKHSKQAAN
ncbi:MAG: hypothetical protein WCK54_20645 [Desulfuromonadales bacterium]